MASKPFFVYETLGQLQEDFARRGFELPASEDLSILGQPTAFGKLIVPNRLVAQPMEGCDSTPAGAPDQLTVRKYLRLAAGGAGLIWFEACAVIPEARANPRQIHLNEETSPAFDQMVQAARAAAQEAGWPRQAFVLQLTHSGRYSRPVNKPAPIIAHHSAVLDPRHKLPSDYPLITDEELLEVQDAFVRAARLAAQVGFDGVDVKSCHGYLLNELLASFTRDDAYAKRTWMLRETFRRVREAVGARLEVTTRMSASDAIDYPYGWGVSKADCAVPNWTEPLAMVNELVQMGLREINITVGNPYFNPHVNRPSDRMVPGWPEPPEHPVVGMNRILTAARVVQAANPGLAVIGSGLSWLRQFGPQVAAGLIRDGWMTLAGWGRGSIACPDFVADILRPGGLKPNKICITCSGCTQLMREGKPSGCVVRDHVYRKMLTKNSLPQ